MGEQNKQRASRTLSKYGTISEQGSFFENFWTVTDLAEHLKVSPATIYDWVHQRVIPYQKIRGRLLRFRPSEIEKWLSQ